MYIPSNIKQMVVSQVAVTKQYEDQTNKRINEIFHRIVTLEDRPDSTERIESQGETLSSIKY
jgi:hypothetical protein